MITSTLQNRVGVAAVKHRQDDSPKAAKLCKANDLYQSIHRTRDYVRLYRDPYGKVTATDLYRNVKDKILHDPETRYASAVLFEADKRLDRSKHLPRVTQTPTDRTARLSCIVMTCECGTSDQAREIAHLYTGLERSSENYLPDFEWAIWQDGNLFLVWRLQRTASKDRDDWWKRYRVMESQQKMYAQCQKQVSIRLNLRLRGNGEYFRHCDRFPLKGEILIGTDRDATDLTIFAGLIDLNNKPDAGEIYVLQKRVLQTMRKERAWTPGGLQHDQESEAEKRALRQRRKLERDARIEFVRAFLLDLPDATAKQICEQAPPELQLSRDMSKRLRREIRRDQADMQRIKGSRLVDDIIRLHRDKTTAQVIGERLGISRGTVEQIVEDLGAVYEIAAGEVEPPVQVCRANRRALNEAAVQVLINGRPNITAKQVVEALPRFSVKQAERLLTKLRPKDPTRAQTILRLHQDGWTNKAIAELLGCCTKTVYLQLEKQAA
jgi:hypothetical protein